VLQAEIQIVFAVVFVCGVTLPDAGAPFGSGADGTRQVVWQVAAAALQLIMQFVTVELCASRILPVASAEVANTPTDTERRSAIKPRMSRLLCRKPRAVESLTESPERLESQKPGLKDFASHNRLHGRFFHGHG
jgi:hypothetical protein